MRNNVDSRVADEGVGGDGQGALSVLTRTRSRSGSLNRASRLDPMRQMRIPDTLHEHHCLGVTAGMTKTALRRALCRSPSQRERLSGLFQQIDIRAPSEACQSASRTLASTQRGRRRVRARAPSGFVDSVKHVLSQARTDIRLCTRNAKERRHAGAGVGPYLKVVGIGGALRLR